MRSAQVFLALVGASCFFSAGAAGQIAGDPNADSLVNIGDVVYEINYLYRDGPPPIFYECGDPNVDCLINVGDIVCLVNYLFRAGPDPQMVECGWKDPINLGPPVNSGANDLSVSFSYDFKRLALESTRYPSYGNWDVFYSDWDSVAGSWQDPINCGANVNDGLGDDQPCISADGNTIYFGSYGRPGGAGGWDIFASTWDSISQAWGVAENLGLPINSSHTERGPFITVDGAKLWFSSGIYPSGICVSEWIDGEWGTPVWLGENINLGAGESTKPTVTADGKVLYFERWADDKQDAIPRIWVSYWNGNEWGPPLMLSPVINAPGIRASNPWVTPDGAKLHFSAKHRPGGVGNWDIWVSERIPIQQGKRFINRESDSSK